MIKKLILIMVSSIILLGCHTTNKVTNLNYDEKNLYYKWDHWDYYINAVRSGEVVFSWIGAGFIYIITNIEVFDARPDMTDVEFYERAGIRVIIFRWRW